MKEREVAKRKFEELLDELREQGVEDDLLEEFEAYKGSNLRQRAEKSAELEAEIAALKAENKGLKDAPARVKAFGEYGINLDELRPAEREALLAAEAPEEGEFTSEWVGRLAEKYDLQVAQGAGQEGETPPAAAAQVVQATSPAQKASKTTLSPEDIQGKWTTEQIVRFKEQHPEEFEALKRGETVVGIAAPAA